jgi:hypothetical protein
MQMRAIGKLARPAEASVGEWVAVDRSSQKNHVWLNDRNDVCVKQNNKCET